MKKEYIVIGYYTIATQVEVMAESREEAKTLAIKKIGRDVKEYEKVDFDIDG